MMNVAIYQSMSSFRQILNWFFLLILFVFGALGAKDFEGPAFGHGAKAQWMEVSQLPRAAEIAPSMFHAVHSHAINAQQLEQLKHTNLPPFTGDARPEIDESVSASQNILGGELSDSFEGISYTGWIPPDPVIAAGQNHVLLLVNASVAIYNKVWNIGNPKYAFGLVFQCQSTFFDI